MLIARLNKLSPEKIRIMLCKHFNKAIDLRYSSRKLELRILQLEREKDAWEWKERVLSNALRQAPLKGERNTVLLQRQLRAQKALILSISPKAILHLFYHKILKIQFCHPINVILLLQEAGPEVWRIYMPNFYFGRIAEDWIDSKNDSQSTDITI